MANNILADLILRLSTNSVELTKGLAKANSSLDGLKKNTQNIGGQVVGSFLKMGGALLTVDAAVKVFEKSMNSTGKTEDLLAESTAYLTGGIDKFFQMIGKGDLSNFITQLTDAAEASKKYAQAQDSIGEQKVGQSLNEALASKQLQDYEIIFRTRKQITDEARDALKAEGQSILLGESWADTRRRVLDLYVKERQELAKENLDIAKNTRDAQRNLILNTNKSGKIGGIINETDLALLQKYFENRTKLESITINPKTGEEFKNQKGEIINVIEYVKELIDTEKNAKNKLDALKSGSTSTGGMYPSIVTNDDINNIAKAQAVLDSATKAKEKFFYNNTDTISPFFNMVVREGVRLTDLLKEDDIKSYLKSIEDVARAEANITTVNLETLRIKQSIAAEDKADADLEAKKLKDDKDKAEKERVRLLVLQHEQQLIHAQNEELKIQNALNQQSLDDLKTGLGYRRLFMARGTTPEEFKGIPENIFKNLKNEVIKFNPNVSSTGDDFLELLKTRATEYKDAMQNLRDTISTGIIDLSTTVLEGFGRMFGGEKIDLGLAFFTVLGNALIQIGKILIEASTVMVGIKAALKTLFVNPATGFIAGAAAILLGGLIIGTATRNAQKASKMASGGIAFGPTYAQVGEYAGARSNPEVVAPLDKLKGMLGNPMGGEVIFRIGDRELVGILTKASLKQTHF